MCKFESSQKHESRAQLADSSKAYKKPKRAFNWTEENALYECMEWIRWDNMYKRVYREKFAKPIKISLCTDLKILVKI